jgi:hypothetical protein
LCDYVKSDTSTLQKQLHDCEFLKELTLLADITAHLNDLNTKLQGKAQTVPRLFGNVNRFCNKLSLFNTCLEKSDLSHFTSCKDLAEELKDFGGSEFSTLASKIENVLSEFSVHFSDFEATKKDILLYNSPLNVVIKK